MEETADFSINDYLTSRGKDNILMIYRQIVEYLGSLNRFEKDKDSDNVSRVQGLINSARSEIRSYLDEAIMDYFYYRSDRDKIAFDDNVFHTYLDKVYSILFRDSTIKSLGTFSFGEYAGKYGFIVMLNEVLKRSFWDAIGKSRQGKPKKQVSMDEPIPGTTQTYEDILADRPEVEDVFKKAIQEYVYHNFGDDVKGNPGEYLTLLFQDIIPAVEAAEKHGVEDSASVMRSALDKSISRHLPLYKNLFQQETGTSVDSLPNDQVPGEWQWLIELSTSDQILNVIEHIKSELD